MAVKNDQSTRYHTSKNHPSDITINMRFTLSIILTLISAFLPGLWLPWWSIAIASFMIGALIQQSHIRSFFSGFIGLFILWGGLALWINVQNAGILSRKIAMILPLGGSSFLLIIVTAFVGALVAGFAALSGSLLRSLR